ncbi:MAG: TetR/AcrR family transcriptional regulator [Chloroflexota bacterium]|nr:TetR/AcrR family transcriptional regulator [Chloroflexota bacterium]
MKDKDTSGTRAARLRAASQQRRHHERQEVRAAILKASSALFLERGYQDFSLRQVAEQIGYAPGTIYLYFKDKDDVLFTILDEGSAHFGALLLEAAQIAEPRERLVSIGRAFIGFGLGNPAFFQLMFMQRTDYWVRAAKAAQASSADGEPGRAEGAGLLGLFTLWRATIEDAMKAGVLRLGDPSAIADVLFSLMYGVVAIAVVMPNFDQKRIDAMIDATYEMLRVGLHAPA